MRVYLVFAAIELVDADFIFVIDEISQVTLLLFTECLGTH